MRLALAPALLLVPLIAYAAPPAGNVSPTPECATAKTANDCADILKKLGKNPFEAFGTVGAEPVYGQQQTPAPPCKNGAANCQPWERDWSNTTMQPGSVVTASGTLVPPSFTDAQLQSILSAVDGLKSSGFHWNQALPVFLSAFLGMGVGIGLDMFKRKLDKGKAADEKRERELSQLNVALHAISYNITRLIHMVMMQFLTHRRDSYAAHRELIASEGNSEARARFALTLPKYKHMMISCPELHLIELDFLRDLPFTAKSARTWFNIQLGLSARGGR